jgi:hypothetical protein
VNYVSPQTTTIFRLSPENVAAAWPQLEPLIEKALLGTPTVTTEDVFRLLMAHRADAWVQMDNDLHTQPPIIQAMAVTDYDVYPQGVWLRVWLCTVADGYKLSTMELHDKIVAWKVQQRCRGLVLVGRPGWTRIFPEAQVEGLILRMTDPPEGET